MRFAAHWGGPRDPLFRFFHQSGQLLANRRCGGKYSILIVALWIDQFGARETAIMVRRTGGGLDFSPLRARTVASGKYPEDIAESRQENFLFPASKLAALWGRFLYPQASAR
jgi:hypothetical protein